MKNLAHYSVMQLAKLAGVTAKTLHLYDRISLLKPAERTLSGYRLYGENELLRLQQILFYKELDFPLKEIASVLDDTNFDLVKTLEQHKKMLKAKKTRISTLLNTIDKTIHSLKNQTMLKLEELYDGLSKDEAAAYRNQAISAYGAEVVMHAESHLKTLNKAEMQALISRQKELGAALYQIRLSPPDNLAVQQLIELHYQNTRKLWGTDRSVNKQADAYHGLGQLYLTDERFTNGYGTDQENFRFFISKAISIYAENNLR